MTHFRVRRNRARRRDNDCGGARERAADKSRIFLPTDPNGDTLTYSVSGFSTAFNVPPPRINATTGEVEVVTEEYDDADEVVPVV